MTDLRAKLNKLQKLSEVKHDSEYAATARVYMPLLIEVARAAEGWQTYLAVHGMGMDLISALGALKELDAK